MSGLFVSVKNAIANAITELKAFYAASSGASELGHLPSGTGALNTTVQTQLRNIQEWTVNTKDAPYYAAGDNTTNDYTAFNACFTDNNDVYIPAAQYLIGTARLGEYQKPLNVIGAGADTVIRIGATNADNTAFRVGAVGGAYYQTRAVTKFESLTFKPPVGAVAPYVYTGIDVEATFPIVLKDITCIGMGPDSIKATSCYYGYFQGLSLVNSGLTFSDVNNIEISGGDIRADEVAVDATKGLALFGNVSKYPVQMTESDLIKFSGTVFEGWDTPVIRLVRCYNTVFNGSWFEGNTASSQVIKIEQSQSLEFNNCQLDFGIPYVGCFIKVDNSIPTADESVRWSPFIRINGGYLLLMSIPFGDAPHFVKTTNAEKCTVLIEGTTFRGGNLYADRTVEFDVKSLLLSGAFKHNFYSKPNAALFPKYNRWLSESVSADWDFALGANFTATAGLTVATTTTAGEYMTGTRGVKVSTIPSDNALKLIQRTTTGEMAEVTAEGQTYLVYVRVKCDQNVTFKPTVNGGFADFAGTPNTDLPANTWRDYVFKTQEDVTWAQGRFFTPKIYLYVTNNSGSVATLYIDRIDYHIVNGDVQL